MAATVGWIVKSKGEKTMKTVLTAEDRLINNIIIQYYDNKKTLGENVDIKMNSKTKSIHRTFVMQTIY